MIFGLDHVALACADLETGVAELTRAGYRVTFTDRGLPNAVGKAPFLNHYQHDHAIAYCTIDGGPAIEMTDYGRVTSGETGAYEVLLRGELPGGDPSNAGDERWTSIWDAAFAVKDSAPVAWNTFSTRCWAPSASIADPRIRALAVVVPDLVIGVPFWRDGLGARLLTSGQVDDACWQRMRINSLFGRWSLDLVLVEGERRSPRLDDAGFPCVALLTSDLQRDRERLAVAGATASTGPFAVTVNGRPLGVEIVRGPSGELIELIELIRDPNP